MSEKLRGRVTIPTDVDVVPETLELVKRWGADAIRDCDGTDYPAELRDVDAATAATTAVSGSFSFSAAAADGEMDAVSVADRTGISRDCGAANGRPFCSFSLYFLLSEACFPFFSSRTPHRSRRQHFHL